MAFCNACGTVLEAGARFCPKCGAPSPASGAAAPGGTLTPATAGDAPIAAPAQGSSALKIILIIFAVIIGIAILAMGTCAFVVHRVVSRSHIENRNGNVKVETPFGSVDTTQDPAEAARSVGVDLYPGATVNKEGTANLSFGGMHTSTVQLETDDTPSAVHEFYKSKLPNAKVMSSQGDRYTLMSGDKNNMTTVTIEPRDSKTRIEIVKVEKGGSSD
ncbi:MAG: zinc ribbon domain-containing protein [Terriglobales bacterium]